MTDEEIIRAAFLRFVQQDNGCQAYATGRPCHSHKCGCAIEMQVYINQVRGERTTPPEEPHE